MTLSIDLSVLGRGALALALVSLAACPAGDDSEDGGGTDDPTATTMTTTMTATTTPMDTSGSDTTPIDVDYATDIQPIWDANCTAACHEAGGISGAATFVLTAGASHNALTTQKPVYSTEMNFVVAGDAEGSFLIDALRHPAGTIVRQMPLMINPADPTMGVAGTPLPESTIALIEAWIDAGANP